MKKDKKNKIKLLLGILVAAVLLTGLLWTQFERPTGKSGGTLPVAEQSVEMQAGL